jgi:hypothetical protein
VLPSTDDLDLDTKKPTTTRGPKSVPGQKRPEVKTVEIPQQPARKPTDDDDEDGAGTYTFQNSDQQDGPSISYVPDTSIKDLRGPATLLLVRPSNALIYAGMMGVLWSFIYLVVQVWPFIFKPEGGYSIDYEEELLDHYKDLGKNQKPPSDPKMLSAEDKEYVDKVQSDDTFWRIIKSVLLVLQIMWSFTIAVGAVKMQNLESYNWSMTSAIMAINPGNAVFAGVWALVILNKPEVKAGFEFKGSD